MKATKAEILTRVSQILQIRLNGAEWPDICQYASENGWKLSDRQLRRYIARTDDILAETLEKNRDKIFNRHIGQRRALFARAMSVSDYPTCLRILRDEAELFGLYPITGRSGHQPEGGSSGAAIEAVALKIVQNLTLNLGNGEQTAEQLMRAAEQLRQQAALLSQEKQIHAAPSRQETEPCQPAAISG
jgi:hypothetical protein